MAVKRFPVESGHLLMFARSIGDASETYSDEAAAAPHGLKGVAAPPTFVQSGAQFDPDFPLRPKVGQKWFGSGSTPSGLSAGKSDGDKKPGGEKKPAGGGALHAEQRFDFVRPVRVEDVLTGEQRAGRSWEKEGRKGGKLVFSESVTEYRDTDGELVVTATAVAVTTTRAPADSEKGGDQQ